MRRERERSTARRRGSSKPPTSSVTHSPHSSVPPEGGTCLPTAVTLLLAGWLLRFVDEPRQNLQPRQTRHLSPHPQAPNKTCTWKVQEDSCKATWNREFINPWREAGPPNHHDDKVDSDQWVVNKELSRPAPEGQPQRTATDRPLGGLQRLRSTKFMGVLRPNWYHTRRSS